MGQGLQGRSSVATLADVILAALADGEVLTYEAASARWKNKVAGAGAGVELQANKGIANGYCGLDAAIKIATANLGGAGADNTKFLRGDQTWQVPSSLDLTVAQRQTAGIHPSYVIFKHPTSGLVYGQSTRSSLADVGPDADAYVVFNGVDAALNGIGGGSAFIKEGTFDFGTEFSPHDKTEWIGESLSRTILRPADSGVNPLIDINRQQGTNNRQEKIVFSNMQINSRDFASSVAIRHYNLKDSRFSRLWLQGWKSEGIYQDAFSVAGSNIWNKYHEIYADASPNAGTKSLFYMLKYSSDSYIKEVSGTLTGGVGITFHGANAWKIDDFHLVDIANLFRLSAPAGGAISTNMLAFNRFHSDTATDHGIVIENTANTMSQLTFNDGVFLVTPANKDLFYIDIGGGQNLKRMTVFNCHCPDTTHRYIAQWTGAGALDHVLFRNNQMRAGATGSYLNINPYQVLDDYAWIKTHETLHNGCINDLPADTTTYYLPISGSGSQNATVAYRYQLFPKPGVLRNLATYLTSVPAGVAGRTFYVYINGAVTTLTTVYGAAESGAKIDATHEVVVAANDRICVQMVPTGTPAVSTFHASVEFYKTSYV